MFSRRSMAIALIRPDVGLFVAFVGRGPIIVQFAASVVRAKA